MASLDRKVPASLGVIFASSFFPVEHFNARILHIYKVRSHQVRIQNQENKIFRFFKSSNCCSKLVRIIIKPNKLTKFMHMPRDCQIE